MKILIWYGLVTIYNNDVGRINGNNVFLVQSEMGSGRIGASLLTVKKGITDLSPNEVIMVGIAFGLDPEKQSTGDVLVSKQLMLYNVQQIGTKDRSIQIIPRGDRPSASARLVSYFKNANLYRNKSKFNVHFGLILSGEKLVDNIDFRQRLLDLEPEAIGGEMEGAGLYVACNDSGVDWIVVKSICDWADGNKNQNKKNQQKIAAKNAAGFVLNILQLIPFNGRSRERGSVSSMESLSNKNKSERIIHSGSLGTNTFAKDTEDAMDKLYKKQQLDEIQNNAKAIDIIFAKFCAPKFQKFAELYKN